VKKVTITHRSRGKKAVLIAPAALVFAIAGCSSSTATSTNGGTSQSQAGSVSAQVTAAKAATAKFSTPATTIGDTTPLKSKPPAGKTIVWLQCEVTACTTAGQGISAATDALGWKMKTITYQSTNPATLISAFTSALQLHPAAVILSGIPQSVWSSVIPAYKSAGVPIIPFSTGVVTKSATVLTNINPPSDFYDAGTIYANWFIADSNAKGNVLVQAVPADPIFMDFEQGFQSTVKAGCSKCKVTVLNSTLTDADNNAIVPDIVSDIQRDPKITYVVAAFAAYITGLRAALSGADLSSSIKIAAAQGTIIDQKAILAGTESVTTPSQLRYMGWMSVDAVLHHLEGMPITSVAQSVPNLLLTKSNIGTPQNDYVTPSSYEAQFKKLWLLG
jgi:ribose transport system substrate-binding protein